MDFTLSSESSDFLDDGLEGGWLAGWLAGWLVAVSLAVGWLLCLAAGCMMATVLTLLMLALPPQLLITHWGLCL